MSASPNREMFDALLDELALVIGAVIDSPARVVPAEPLSGRHWVTRIAADGAVAGAMTVVLDADGALTMTRLMTGVEGDVTDDVIHDAVKEVMAQAVGALAQKPVARSASLSVVDVAPGEALATDGEWTGYAIGAQKLPVAIAAMTSGSLAAQASAGTASALRPVPPAAAAAKGSESAAAAFDERMNVILDIDLPLVVRFGRTELPLKALTRLGPGSVIDLGRSPDDPVEVLVSNRVVARGEVVIVSGSYGIRILDVVSPRERVRSMEA